MYTCMYGSVNWLIIQVYTLECYSFTSNLTGFPQNVSFQIFLSIGINRPYIRISTSTVKHFVTAVYRYRYRQLVTSCCSSALKSRQMRNKIYMQYCVAICHYLHVLFISTVQCQLAILLIIDYQSTDFHYFVVAVAATPAKPNFFVRYVQASMAHYRQNSFTVQAYNWHVIHKCAESKIILIPL